MNALTHVMITGGASGIGLAMAQRYLKRGSKVTILDLKLNDDVAATLDNAGTVGTRQWQFLACDITDAAAVNSRVKSAVAEFGAPQLAVNSAGIGGSKRFSEVCGDEFNTVIRVNLSGSFNFAKAVLPAMNKGSRLALIASMAGITSNYGYSSYGPSKFGVVGLATTLRYEYQPLGINISCICPPEIKTPMVAEEHAKGDPVALDVKKFAGSLEIDPAVDEIVRRLDKGQWMIIPGFKAKYTAFVSRYLPRLATRITLFLISRSMRQHGRL